MKHPSYCCQACGDCIGWIGRALQIIGLSPHRCRTSHTTYYDQMTPEQAKAFAEVSENMDGVFRAMDRAFKTLR